MNIDENIIINLNIMANPGSRPVFPVSSEVLTGPVRKNLRRLAMVV
jgi:hypothetical protein